MLDIVFIVVIDMLVKLCRMVSGMVLLLKLKLDCMFEILCSVLMSCSVVWFLIIVCGMIWIV